MTARIDFAVNAASWEEIAAHLAACDGDFQPALSARVDIPFYARKIHSQAVRFEVWREGVLVGLLAAYCNDPEGRGAFITNVSVCRELGGQGVGSALLNRCLAHARALGMTKVGLRVAKENEKARRLYVSAGFAVTESGEGDVGMEKML